jgi:hypothetical protein
MNSRISSNLASESCFNFQVLNLLIIFHIRPQIHNQFLNSYKLIPFHVPQIQHEIKHRSFAFYPGQRGPSSTEES